MKIKGFFVATILLLVMSLVGCAGGAAVQTPTATPTPQPTPVSSEEVSSRVQSAMNNVDTLQGTMLITTRTSASTYTARGLVWFQRPQSLKVQITDVLEGSDGKGTVFVFDGQSLTIYDPQSNTTTRVDTIPQAIGLAVLSPNMSNLLMKFSQIRPFLVELDTTLKDFDAFIIGTDVVAGRPTQILRLIPRQPTSTIQSVLVWVQQEDWLPLKIQTIDPNNVTTLDLEFEKVDFNVPLSSDTFTATAAPTPTAGTAVPGLSATTSPTTTLATSTPTAGTVIPGMTGTSTPTTTVATMTPGQATNTPPAGTTPFASTPMVGTSTATSTPTPQR